MAVAVACSWPLVVAVGGGCSAAAVGANVLVSGISGGFLVVFAACSASAASAAASASTAFPPFHPMSAANSNCHGHGHGHSAAAARCWVEGGPSPGEALPVGSCAHHVRTNAHTYIRTYAPTHDAPTRTHTYPTRLPSYSLPTSPPDATARHAPDAGRCLPARRPACNGNGNGGCGCGCAMHAI